MVSCVCDLKLHTTARSKTVGYGHAEESDVRQCVAAVQKCTTLFQELRGLLKYIYMCFQGSWNL